MRDFTAQLLALQPPGLALPRDADTNWVKLLDALAQELSRVDGRLSDLVTEITLTSNASEMLGDWETALGLPDPCAPPPTDRATRLARIRAKLSSVGGQSVAYFLGILGNLGYAASIRTLQPFLMGKGAMGDTIGGYEWANTWQINIPGTVDPDIYKLLQCVIMQNKPAHTAVLWAFDNKPPMAKAKYNGQFKYDGTVIYGGY